MQQVSLTFSSTCIAVGLSLGWLITVIGANFCVFLLISKNENDSNQFLAMLPNRARVVSDLG